MALGVPDYDPRLSQQAMSMNAGLLRDLGQQVRKDVQTVITNHQMKGLAQGLQNVDTTSPQFGRQIVGLMSEYPMAVQSPIGQAAITQLGAEFKLNQQKEIAREAFGNRIGIETLRDYRDRRDYGAPPMTRGEAEAVANGTAQPEMPTGPVTNPPPATGDPGTVYPPTDQLESLPTAGSTDLFGDKQFLQQTGGQPSIPAAQPTAIPGLERLMQTRQAVAKLPRKEGEAAMRAAAAQLGRAPAVRANITNADGTIWSQLQDGSLIPAVDPRTGQQMRAMPKGGDANTAADNARADASLKLREATANRTRAERVLKEMKDTGVNSPGPWEEGGKWYHNTTKGREEITPVMAKRWMELNHEYTQAENAYKQAMSPATATAAPAAAAGSGKPLPQEILQQASQAIKEGRSRAGVVKKLQDLGYDVSGL